MNHKTMNLKIQFFKVELGKGVEGTEEGVAPADVLSQIYLENCSFDWTAMHCTALY